MPLLSFTGCKKSDSKNANTPEECKALETIYTAYNTFYTCSENVSEVEYTIDYTTNPGGLISAEDAKKLEEYEQKHKECYNNFKKSYDTIPTKTIEQMIYFHHFHGLFNSEGQLTLNLQDPSIIKPKAGQTKEHGLKAREALKPYPLHLCSYEEMESVYEKLTPMSDGEGDPSFENEKESDSFFNQLALSYKKCMKELGETEYQESKKKFNCD